MPRWSSAGGSAFLPPRCLLPSSQVGALHSMSLTRRLTRRLNEDTLLEVVDAESASAPLGVGSCPSSFLLLDARHGHAAPAPVPLHRSFLPRVIIIKNVTGHAYGFRCECAPLAPASASPFPHPHSHRGAIRRSHSPLWPQWGIGRCHAAVDNSDLGTTGSITLSRLSCLTVR